MLTEDSGIATMEKLATRSEAASKLRTTIQQCQTDIDDEGDVLQLCTK